MGGFELKLGTFKGCLWYDALDNFYQKPGWGIKLAIRWGPMVCPIKRPRSKESRWNDPWFTIRLPWVIGPFISIALGTRGLYLGLKDNGWGLNNILILSATIRRDRRK